MQINTSIGQTRWTRVQWYVPRERSWCAHVDSVLTCYSDGEPVRDGGPGRGSIRMRGAHATQACKPRGRSPPVASHVSRSRRLSPFPSPSLPLPLSLFVSVCLLVFSLPLAPFRGSPGAWSSRGAPQWKTDGLDKGAHSRLPARTSIGRRSS